MVQQTISMPISGFPACLPDEEDPVLRLLPAEELLRLLRPDELLLLLLLLLPAADEDRVVFFFEDAAFFAEAELLFFLAIQNPLSLICSPSAVLTAPALLPTAGLLDC